MTDEQWTRAEGIQGWFGRGEAEFLYSLVDGPWCEVGCWKGRSTTVLAETGFPGWAVDHFKGSPEHPEGTDTLDEFMRNIGSYPNVRVLPYKFRGAAAMVPNDLSLVFLDADHSYEQTRLAFELYAPKVRPRGHIAIHDGVGGGWDGVERFLAELRTEHAYQELRAVEHTVAFHKC